MLGMHGPTCIFWANFTAFSFQRETDAETGLLTNILPPDGPEREGYEYADMARGSTNVFHDPSHRLTVMLALDAKVNLTPPCIFHW
jgi:hypothetical protein